VSSAARESGRFARLVITRDHPLDVQDRPVYLWVDGEKWDKVLRYGTIFTRDIAPGRHKLKVHNTLFGHTVEFDAAPGEEIKYRCENGLTGGGMVMVLMLGVAYLRVRLTRIVAA
jgi:hypothetical protein